jgi:hypothetical protein
MTADVEKIKESLNRKIKKAAEILDAKGMKYGKAGMWATAGLTDQEIMVMAAIRVNNERESIRWEGFIRSDQDNDKAIDRRFETIKKIIAKSEF